MDVEEGGLLSQRTCAGKAKALWTPRSGWSIWYTRARTLPALSLCMLGISAQKASPTLGAAPAPAPGLFLPRTSNISGSGTGICATSARPGNISRCLAGLCLVM